MCKLPVSSRSGRTGEGHLRVCWSRNQSANPSRSATIISIHVGRTPNKKELALHIHYFLALNAKSYNDTT